MEPVTVELTDDAMAVVRINNPPVNALSHAVRSGLMNAVRTVHEADVDAVLLICEGRTFIAGADIREFDQPARTPHLGDVIHAIESSTVPWIAAIHGTALGGGLEVALGCASRIAVSSARLGLPEVNLGLIPGAGGTVRLPRLIDPIEAMKLIVSGKPVSAQIAHELGLIDLVIDGDILKKAKTYTKNFINEDRRLPLSDTSPKLIPAGDIWIGAVETALRKKRGELAPKIAAEQIHNALSLPFKEGLDRERDRFLKLKTGPQSEALRHIFFAERSAVGRADLKGIEPSPLSHIGIVGAGTMGSGIAASCLLQGLQVSLMDREERMVKSGLEKVRAILGQSERRGRINTHAKSEMLSRLQTGHDYTVLASCEVIIEAVFEDMAVKQAVFKDLDQVAPNAILASNTSYLDIQTIAEAVQDPSRVIGLHFFSPAHIMKLVEVIHTDQSSLQALSTGFSLAKRLRKLGVSSGVCHGFIANRMMSAYRQECEFMLEDGTLPWVIDQAMRQFGFPMGVFEMQDLAGLDIGWARRKAEATSRDPADRYVDIPDQICALGRFGRKTGRGWYIYEEDGSRPDPEIEALILAESKRKSIQRQSISEDEIMHRILAAMTDQAEMILKEGIAQSPEVVDVVMVNGFGFPRWRGGPMFMKQKSIG